MTESERRRLTSRLLGARRVLWESPVPAERLLSLDAERQFLSSLQQIVGVRQEELEDLVTYQMEG